MYSRFTINFEVVTFISKFIAFCRHERIYLTFIFLKSKWSGITSFLQYILKIIFRIIGKKNLKCLQFPLTLWLPNFIVTAINSCVKEVVFNEDRYNLCHHALSERNCGDYYRVLMLLYIWLLRKWELFSFKTFLKLNCIVTLRKACTN